MFLGFGRVCLTVPGWRADNWEDLMEGYVYFMVTARAVGCH